MKNIFTSAFLFLSVSAFAQDTKKDTTTFDYGARIYDARIGRYMSVDPKQSKENNPYQFSDTIKCKLIETYTLDNDCLDTVSNMFSSIESRKMVIDLNNMSGLKGEFITIMGKDWCIFELTDKSKKQNKYQGVLNQNELKISDKFSLFVIERNDNFLFIAPNNEVLYVYALAKTNKTQPLLNKIYLIEIFKLSAKQFNSNLIICK